MDHFYLQVVWTRNPQTMSLPFIYYKLKEYELKTSSSLSIQFVVGSILLFMMCMMARWSTTTSKSTFFSRCEKVTIFMAKPTSLTL